MSGRRAYFFRIGEFSLINDALWKGLRAQWADLDWRMVDVERDIVRCDPMLHGRAIASALRRYGRTILAQRQPPRDFFPRIPSVLEAVRKWVRAHVDPKETALVFQTQSLFDARHPMRPHFLYTDHTYLANRRYAEPRPLLPVAKGWAKMERELYRDARCSFVSSGFAAESLREDYQVPSDRVEVVYSGSNIEGGEPGERRGRVILFVGVDWERKGGPELLAAFRAVKVAVPEAELWIVGCRPEIAESGVRVFGRIPPPAVAACYAAADIFCLPSRMDPSASVLAEAAAYELPVVATPVGGNPERVVHGMTGFLCAPSELAGRLIELLKSAEMREAFGKAGRRLVGERFTWAAVCAKMVSRMQKEIGL